MADGDQVWEIRDGQIIDATWRKIADTGTVQLPGGFVNTGPLYTRPLITAGEIECCAECMTYVRRGGKNADSLEEMRVIHLIHTMRPARDVDEDPFKGPPAGRDRFA